MAISLSLLVLIVVGSREVHSQQTFPYVSFNGQTLTNHSYVDLSLVGDDGSGSDSVQCHTDLSTCCGTDQGSHRGDWYFPNGTRLPFPGKFDFFENRGAQRVDLRRPTSAISPTCLYHCDITVHDDTDTSVRDRVYVGLYTASGGDIRISGGVTLTVDSDLNGGSPQFTLTCISTGGPATTVTWTRDSTTVTERTETVLNDPVTANYTHTLTVTGRLGGLYRCTVKNNKPSSDIRTFTLQVASAPTNLKFVVLNDSTSVLLSWTPPSPLGATTGYTISYSGGGSSSSVTVDGGSTNSHTLTGLSSGETYTISVAGTSDHFFSESVNWTINLPEGLVVEVVVMGSTSISISWSVPGGSVVSSELVWRAVGGSGASGSSGSLSSTSYTIENLQQVSVYNVTVTASTAASGTFCESIITFTVPECGSGGWTAAAGLGGVLGVVVVAASMVLLVLLAVIVLLLRRLREAEKSSTASTKRSLKMTSSEVCSAGSETGGADDGYEAVIFDT